MTDAFVIGAFHKVGAWHEKGEVFQEIALPSVKATELGMDYEVTKEQLFIKVDGVDLPVKNKFALTMHPNVFSKTSKVLNIVGNRYQPIQNMDIANTLNPLSEKWPLASLGVLNNGLQTFFCLRMEPFDVGGNSNETHEIYLTVADNKAVMQACDWLISGVRVVCQNTYALARSKAKESGKLVKIWHTQDPIMQLKLRADLELAAIAKREHNMSVLNALFKFSVDKFQSQKIVESAFPLPSTPKSIQIANNIPDNMDTKASGYFRERANKVSETHQLNVERIKKHRSQTMGRLEVFNEQHSYTANTAYAVIQAVTEEVNHSNIYRGNMEKQGASILFGDRAKAMAKAIDTAVGIMQTG